MFIAADSKQQTCSQNFWRQFMVSFDCTHLIFVLVTSVLQKKTRNMLLGAKLLEVYWLPCDDHEGLVVHKFDQSNGDSGFDTFLHELVKCWEYKIRPFYRVIWAKMYSESYKLWSENGLCYTWCTPQIQPKTKVSSRLV